MSAFHRDIKPPYQPRWQAWLWSRGLRKNEPAKNHPPTFEFTLWIQNHAREFKAEHGFYATQTQPNQWTLYLWEQAKRERKERR